MKKGGKNKTKKNDTAVKNKTKSEGSNMSETFKILDVLKSTASGAKSPVLIYGKTDGGWLLCDEKNVALASNPFTEAELLRLGFTKMGEASVVPDVKENAKKVVSYVESNGNGGSQKTKLVCKACEGTGKNSKGDVCAACDGKNVVADAPKPPKASKAAAAVDEDDESSAWADSTTTELLEGYVYGVTPEQAELDDMKAVIKARGIDKDALMAAVDAVIAKFASGVEPKDAPAPAEPKDKPKDAPKAKPEAKKPDVPPAPDPDEEEAAAPAPKKPMLGNLKPGAAAAPKASAPAAGLAGLGKKKWTTVHQDPNSK